MKLKPLTLVIISIALIAGCILTAGCISQTTENDTNEILGDWIYEFTNPNGEESTFTYHFNTDYTGTLTTYSKSLGTSKSTTHWLYDDTEKAYLINYDKLDKQEYMKIYTAEDGTQYLFSIGGGYICTKI